MRRPRFRWRLAVLLLVALGVLVAQADAARRRKAPRAKSTRTAARPSAPEKGAIARIEGPDAAPVRRIDGEPYVAVNDLARLLDATKFWRSDTRKLVLRSGRHSLTFTVDNPFVVVDETTLWLPLPVRSARGELQIPALLVDSLPADSTFARLYFDTRRERIIVLPPSGGVGTPTLAELDGITRLAFPADDPRSAAVVARSRDHFRIRFGGLFTGDLPDSLPAGGLLRALRPLPALGGSAFEIQVDRAASGFRLIQDETRGRVVLELLRRSTPGADPFAAEGPVGPRPVKVVVLDPGHGGSDPGVMAGGAVEKDLALALARALKPELERRLRARVVLTRSDDRAMSADQRAEIANRARADLVLSLHFDGSPAAQARGATAYCPPATFAAPPGSEGGASGSTTLPVVLLPWRDVALRHAVESRALAEAVLTALDLRAQGPTRLRERLAYPLLGINAPALVLECATLTASADRDRVRQASGLADLAATIADGVQTWQRNP